MTTGPEPTWPLRLSLHDHAIARHGAEALEQWLDIQPPQPGLSGAARTLHALNTLGKAKPDRAVAVPDDGNPTTVYANAYSALGTYLSTGHLNGGAAGKEQKRHLWADLTLKPDGRHHVTTRWQDGTRSQVQWYAMTFEQFQLAVALDHWEDPTAVVEWLLTTQMSSDALRIATAISLRSTPRPEAESAHLFTQVQMLATVPNDVLATAALMVGNHGINHIPTLIEAAAAVLRP